MVGNSHEPLKVISRAHSAKLISSQSNKCTAPKKGTNNNNASRLSLK